MHSPDPKQCLSLKGGSGSLNGSNEEEGPAHRIPLLKANQPAELKCSVLEEKVSELFGLKGYIVILAMKSFIYFLRVR